MEIRLDGKKAVISGSTAGIGYAIAEGLARAGAAVVISGRTEARVQSALRRLRDKVPNARADGVTADLSHAAGTDRLTAEHPQADILVNNLGVFGPKPFFAITDEEWEEYFQTNVMSAVRLSRHYTPEMVRRGWGRVLFNASAVAGFLPGEQVHFGATKAAVLALSRGLAESIAGTGVTVNAFLPGPTLTEGVRDFFRGQAAATGRTAEALAKEMFAEELPTSILQRFIEPAEIAGMVVYLASEAASAVTGAALRVDGGIMRTIL
ncbi:MAG: SDR family NAD(P)-dependent oxidoreductase [bacterium]